MKKTIDYYTVSIHNERDWKVVTAIIRRYHLNASRFHFIDVDYDFLCSVNISRVVFSHTTLQVCGWMIIGKKATVEDITPAQLLRIIKERGI